MGFVILAIIVIAFIVVITNISVVQQSRAYVIERLGAFHSVWGVGMHFKVPFIDRIARRVSLKEQVLDYPPQPVITKDNVTMQIDTVVYFQITDPKLYAYGVEQPMAAMETLTATTLRNIIGDLELDQTLTSRDVVNTKMRSILDEATDPWGIKVNRVELKNILPPQDIQNSMEKQMKAERDRRQAILQAEGQKKSAILIAEGEKESAILRADAEKQAAILKAEGEAEAIRKVQQALADSLEMLNKSAPQRSGHQAEVHRGHAEGRRRQGHQDHHSLRDAGSGGSGKRHCGRHEGVIHGKAERPLCKNLLSGQLHHAADLGRQGDRRELPVAVQRLRRRADAPLKARRHPRRDAAFPRIRQIADMPPPKRAGAYPSLHAKHPVKSPVQPPVQPHGHQGDRNPQQGKGRTDLPQKISGAAAVVPDLVVLVHQQSRRQLHHGDNPRAYNRPQRPRQNGLHLPQLPDEQKAHPACREHADMAVPPPEQLQPHVSPAADAEEQTFLEKSHVFSPRRKYCQKFQQKNEKMS